MIELALVGVLFYGAWMMVLIYLLLQVRKRVSVDKLDFGQTFILTGDEKDNFIYRRVDDRVIPNREHTLILREKSSALVWLPRGTVVEVYPLPARRRHPKFMVHSHSRTTP